MRKNSLNRKFRRMLAASLGAVSFVSTSCVVNAVDEKLKKVHAVAKYFADPANWLNLRTDVGSPHQNNGARIISGKHIRIDGQVLTLDDTKAQTQEPFLNYRYPLLLDDELLCYVGLKRQAARGGPQLKAFFLAPNSAVKLPDPATLPAEHGNYMQRIIKWLQEKWKKVEDLCDKEIKKQEKAEADAKAVADAKAAADAEEAEKARARETNLLAASNQSMPVYSSQDMSAMSATALMGTALPLALSQIQTSQPIAPVPNETEINNPTLNSTSNNQVGFNSQNSDLNLDNK